MPARVCRKTRERCNRIHLHGRRRDGWQRSAAESTGTEIGIFWRYTKWPRRQFPDGFRPAVVALADATEVPHKRQGRLPSVDSNLTCLGICPIHE